MALTRDQIDDLAEEGVFLGNVYEIARAIEAEVRKQDDALIRQMHPMGYGRPEDVAEAVRYLASASGRWVNGAELVLDGGLTAG